MRPLAAFTAALAIITLTVPAHVLASTQHGALWRLFTSELIADRPAWASVVGFALVGCVTIRVVGGRIALAAAAVGHVLSALVIYGSLDAIHETVAALDFGTSAVIAAWVGVLASHAWSRSRASALALVAVSAVLGWYFKGTVTVLDWEHVVALAVGTTIHVWLPRSRRSIADDYRSLPRVSIPGAISDSSTMLNDNRSSLAPLPSE